MSEHEEALPLNVDVPEHLEYSAEHVWVDASTEPALLGINAYAAGQLGDLPGGWPEPFRTKVLSVRHVDLSITPISAESEANLDGSSAQRREELDELLLAGPNKMYSEGGARRG